MRSQFEETHRLLRCSGPQFILRNCETDFYGDEILDGEDKFSDGYFESLRENGATGIWLRGQLRDLVEFKEAAHWNNRNAERVEALNRIVARAGRHDIGIFLYVNEPKGFFNDDPIFERYPDLKGPVNPLALRPQPSGNQPKYAFCTQSAFVDTYLTGGFAALFSLCPDLAGVIALTASEIFSHCYSNVDERNLMNEDFKVREVECPRCRKSSSVQTVIDVLEKIRAGVRSASGTAKVVAWNWSWGMYEEAPQPSILAGLSRDIIIMSDLQRGGHKTVESFEIPVDEYSFSYLGPSPLFSGTAEIARRQGRELWTKMPVNVTHEFLVVPYLPLFFRLAKKTISIRESHSSGLMGCWNYGGDACTPMARLAARILGDDRFSAKEIDAEIQELAAGIYGREHAEDAFLGWKEFDEAFEYFPFEMPLIYYGPHMHGPGFEWVFTREEIPMPEYYLNRAPRRGTKLSDWCVHFRPEDVIHLLGKLTARWEAGVRRLAAIFGIRDPFDEIPGFEEFVGVPGFEDFTIARTVQMHFLSTIAFIRFRLATVEFFAEPSRRGEMEAIIRDLLEEEKPRIRAMMQVIQSYPRIPVAEEAQKALYTVDDLRQKLVNMEKFRFEENQAI